MLKKRILFSESKQHYDSLGVEPDPKYYDCEYNGIRYYKKEPSFYSKYYCFVSSFYTSSLSMYMALRFRNLGIKTVFVTDGIYDLSNSVNNPLISKYKTYLYEFLPHQYVLSVGNIPQKKMCSRYYKYIPKRMHMKDKVPLPEQSRILITTSNAPCFSDAEQCRLSSLMVDVVSTLVEHTSTKFSFRIFDDKLLSFLKNQFPDLFENDIDGAFEECLGKYTHVITTPSSISVTAMFHDRKVAHFIYRSEPPGVAAAWNIPSKDIFYDSLDSFLGQSPALIEFQKNVYDSFFDFTSDIDDILNDKSINELNERVNWFRETQENRIINSSLNFNLEYICRRIYAKLKSNKLVKGLRKRVKV